MLEAAGSSEELVAELAQSLSRKVCLGQVRLAVDSMNNAFSQRRAIVQFYVTPQLYDWFFNARSGYRAQYWVSHAAGMEFNSRVVSKLANVLLGGLPSKVTARRIVVNVEGNSRHEKDTGTMEIKRSELRRSLAPDVSKIWIGERLYGDGGVTDIGIALLADAARSPAKLRVPRWEEAIHPKSGEKGEGLRAPYPAADSSWLDLKGGFLEAKSSPQQLKSPRRRAEDIHACGWT